MDKHDLPAGGREEVQLEYLAAGLFIEFAGFGFLACFTIYSAKLGQDSPSILEKLGHFITASKAI